MKLSALAKELREKKLSGDCEVTALCTDSRTASEGELFFCYRGTGTDLHSYAEEAAERGACLVCERELPLPCAQLIVPDGRRAMALIAAAFYGHPERGMRFAGVTGTNGKTTTCYLLASVLEESGRRVGLIGTLGARFAGRTVPPDLTTPDPVSLFALLAEMKKAGVQDVVMEVSAHALALEKTVPILFDVGIFTNLTRDHLDFFGDMEKYGAAKKSLFSPARCRFAVYNADDPFTRELLKWETPHVLYGSENPADAFALSEEESVEGSKLILNLSDELCETHLKLLGRHNVQNALAAACAARRLGATVEDVARGLGKVGSVDGRLERVARFRGADIFVDFAHTPDGLEKSLSCLKELCEGRLIALFGCGGNRDGGKRREMGETAARLADFTVITSDNPRFEDPCAIIAAIEEGFCGISKEYVAVEEREKAIEYAVRLLCEGDILLIAGKGGETYQEIMGIKFDYNDKDTVKKIVGKLS